MYLVAIGWLYVALMMALAEGVAPNGGWLGAAITFIFYGLLPTALLLYILGTPGRRRLRRAREAQEQEQEQGQQPADATAAAPSTAATGTAAAAVAAPDRTA
jgi:hypothetical protein